MPNGGEVRVQETRYEPVHIALEKFDQAAIRIEQASFLAAKRLRWRKFVSSLYGEVFLQEDFPYMPFGTSRLRGKELFCLKLFPETMEHNTVAPFSPPTD